MPAGSTWVGPPKSRHMDPLKSVGTTILVEDESGDFCGDRVLAQLCRFMSKAMLSREACYAVADGDVGRIYEVFKVCAQ